MAILKENFWTFDTVADTYEQMRPGYPAELYHDIFKAVALDDSCRAVEVGIGGGQATLPILQTDCRVTAVEREKNSQNSVYVNSGNYRTSRQ